MNDHYDLAGFLACSIRDGRTHPMTLHGTFAPDGGLVLEITGVRGSGPVMTTEISEQIRLDLEAAAAIVRAFGD